jgi:hypothetical protein
MTEYGVVLFHTTSAVLRTEKLLIKKGFSVRLIPTPRQFSSDCGVALRFEWGRCEAVMAALDEARIEFDALHTLDTRGI